MSNSNRFSNLSPQVLNALDRDLPGWQDLVPPEKDSELNEESLIRFLKDAKRAEIYTTIANKRNAFFKESIEGTDKSFFEFIQQLPTFIYEQTNKWIDMEGKLSSIILEFRALPKNKPIDPEKMSKGLDSFTSSVSQQIDSSIDAFNSHFDNYLTGFFNSDVNGISRAGSEELKGFLKTKVDQFKKEHQEIGDQQKKFINNSIKKLIKEKIDKVKTGELSADAFNRSDLFTDEEMNSIHEAQEKIVLDAVINRRNSNVDVANEMAQKFLGVSGKENILQKLNEWPDHIISQEVKTIVSYAMDYGFMLEEENKESNRKTRAIGPQVVIIANVACAALDIAAFALRNMEKEDATKRLQQDIIYNFCNHQIGFWAHIITLGGCSRYTLGVHLRELILSQIEDYKRVSDMLSGFSFLICLFSAKGWIERLKKIANFIGEQIVQSVCDETSKSLEEKSISYYCSAAILVKSIKGNIGKINEKVHDLMKTKI